MLSTLLSGQGTTSFLKVLYTSSVPMLTSLTTASLVQPCTPLPPGVVISHRPKHLPQVARVGIGAQPSNPLVSPIYPTLRVRESPRTPRLRSSRSSVLLAADLCCVSTSSTFQSCAFSSNLSPGVSTGHRWYVCRNHGPGQYQARPVL